jgi:hypothetical protein
MHFKNMSLIIISIALAGTLMLASCGGGSGGSNLAAPTGLTATAGDTKVTLEWNAVDGATSYTLYWGTAPGITKGTVNVNKSDSIASVTSPYAHEGLTNGTTYYYAVAAANSAGEGDLSSEVSATPVLGVPSAVQGLSITLGNKQLTLDWTAYDGATSYKIYWNTSPGIDTSAPNSETSTTNSFLHTDLSNLNTYYYRVAAVNSVGEGALSEEKSATPQFTYAELDEIMGDTQSMSDEFGYAVAIDGDTAIVGAPHYFLNTGTAFVYRYAGGVWSKEAELPPPVGLVTNGTYGQAVSISGDYAIIGNPTGQDIVATGVAVVFKRTGVSWAYEQTLKEGGGALGDKFGAAVAISSDYAVVGAPYDDTGGKTNNGSVYYWAVSGWVPQIPMSGLANNDKYGSSVGISGNFMVIGAPYDDTKASDAGKIFFISLNPFVLSSHVADNGAAGELFGSCIAIDGDVVIAGLSGKQSAILLRNSGGVWSEEQEVVPSSTSVGDKFGASCSISGKYALVGAYLNDDVAPDAGAGFLFKYSGSTWSEEAKLLASDGAAGDQFGFSVGIDGDLIVIGANLADRGGFADSGAAYFY